MTAVLEAIAVDARFADRDSREVMICRRRDRHWVVLWRGRVPTIAGTATPAFVMPTGATVPVLTDGDRIVSAERVWVVGGWADPPEHFAAMGKVRLITELPRG